MTLPFTCAPIISHRFDLPRALVWVSLGCMITSAVGFLPANDNLIWPTLLMLAGAIALGAVLWLRREWGIPAMASSREAGTDGRVRILPLILGIALLALLGLRSAQWMLPVEAQVMIPMHVQVLLLVCGAALLVVGAGGLRRADLASWRVAVKTHRGEILLVLAIMLLALAPRLYQLGDAVRAFMDEGPFLNGLVTMRDNPAIPMLAPLHSIGSFTRLFSYTQLVLSDIFGSSLAVFRLAGVLFGVLTVGATYGLARLLFDRRTAWVAGVLLATFPPHIHMSRIGINNVADPLFGVLALVFFVLGLRTRRRLYTVLVGVMLGFLPYFYEGGELLYPPLLLLWAGILAFNRDTRPSLRGIGWMLLAALVLALPVYYTSISYDLPLFTRLDEASAGGNYFLKLLMSPNGMAQVSDYLRERLLPPLLHYVHAPDPSLFYSGQTALILPPLVVLFLLGLAHALRRRSGLLLVLWVLATVLGNSLIFFNNWTARFVVVMPAIAILCAVGWRYTWAMVWPVNLTPNPSPQTGEGSKQALESPSPLIEKGRFPRGEVSVFLPLRLRLSALPILLLLLSVSQIAYYFGPHLTYYNEQIIELRSHYDVVFRTMRLPADTIVYFHYRDPVQVPFYYALLKYVNDPHEFHAERFENYDFTNLAPQGRFAFFVDPIDPEALAKLEALWYLDGPYFDAGSGLRQSEQFGLYLVTPLLRRS